LEINVNLIFAMERIQQIQPFALEEEIVNLQIIAIVPQVSLEINVK
jgi:hypothetical protein